MAHKEYPGNNPIHINTEEILDHIEKKEIRRRIKNSRRKKIKK
ncbi:MAG: hypothetical protein U9Q99_01235 [Nanoarchaeota archaeon]|nr:hypothetical protein [Nanoarchaeota archaeon]